MDGYAQVDYHVELFQIVGEQLGNKSWHFDEFNPYGWKLLMQREQRQIGDS